MQTLNTREGYPLPSTEKNREATETSAQSVQIAKKTKTKKPAKRLPKERRERYLAVIDYSLNFAVNKIQSQYTQSGQKTALLRAIASLISTGGALLRDEDLEELSERVAKLEHYGKLGGDLSE